MTIVIQIAILTTLGLILIEDLRHRAIKWWLPPVLFVLFLMNTALAGDFPVVDTLYNLGFTVLVLGIAMVYFQIRGVNTIAFFKSKFGIGDVLFLLAITPSVSFRWYPMVFVGGMVASLLISLYPIQSGKWKTIPLAGLFSVWMAGVFCFAQLSPITNPSNTTHTSVRVLRPEGGVYREHLMTNPKSPTLISIRPASAGLLDVTCEEIIGNRISEIVNPTNPV